MSMFKLPKKLWDTDDVLDSLHFYELPKSVQGDILRRIDRELQTSGMTEIDSLGFTIFYGYILTQMIKEKYDLPKE